MERNRLKPTPCKIYMKLQPILYTYLLFFLYTAYLYHEFNVQADFDAAEKYAEDLGVLLWSSSTKRTMVISEA